MEAGHACRCGKWWGGFVVENMDSVRKTIRRGQPFDMPIAAYTLARSFDEDPQVRWFHPQPRSRRRRLRISFESSYQAAYRLSDGVDLAVDEAQRIVGSALWLATPHLRPRLSLTLDEWLTMRRIYGSRTRLATTGTRQIWIPMSRNHTGTSSPSEPPRKSAATATAKPSSSPASPAANPTAYPPTWKPRTPKTSRTTSDSASS